MTVDLRSSRQLHWVSSIFGDASVLSSLDERLKKFYSDQDHRCTYQSMLDTQEEKSFDPDSMNSRLIDLIIGAKPNIVLEVGCGNGWLYRQLRNQGFSGSYHGIEVAPYVIERNANRHPEGQWHTGTAYKIDLHDGCVDVCFSHYVIEHLVYPEKALREMLRILRPSGSLVLTFPDFATLGHLPSQQTGFSPGRAVSKLKRGRVLDAAVTIFDSRHRVRPMLRTASKTVGPFPVNTRPLCLTYPEIMGPDVDAVYLASKVEIAEWASSQGLRVEFPVGTDGLYLYQSMVRISKSLQTSPTIQ